MSTAFQYEELDSKIGLLTFDLPDQKVNTLSRAVWQELTGKLDELEQQSKLKGLLFHSGKPGQYIAGADLKEFGALMASSEEEITDSLIEVHEILNRVNQLPFPTVALIDGNCLGGGTELSLSMDERIATPNTKIGLPEVGLGLIPGWGGTQRLPRLIGINAAIDIICGGKTIPASEAAKLGLVFDIVPAESLIEEGCRLIEHLQQSGDWQTSRATRSGPLGLNEDQATFTFAVSEGGIRGKTSPQHYPAPFIALKAMKAGVNETLLDGLAIERQCALEVVGSPNSSNLISVFFMNNQIGRDPGLKNRDAIASEVNRVGVVGAGLMGAGIATTMARSGVPTVMMDVSEERLADGMGRAQHVIASRMKIGRATEADMVNMLSQLNTSTTHSALSGCEVVVEAVTENEDLKTSIYGQLAEVLSEDAILASNTSTISITRMAEAAPNAEKFVGMHFFYPVDRMQLVEVIRGKKTSDDTVATIVKLAKRARKVPIVMKDCAGFLVNRILLPYMIESVLMLLEGADMDQIDKVATKFGMPMGPIALHDLVGMDTACYAGRVMVGAYSDRMVEPSLLQAMVDAGRMGKKAGVGFRKFVGRKKSPTADPEFNKLLDQHRTDTREFTDEEIEDRLFLAMLLEAQRTLEEEIVSEPAHLEMGLILGIGFPAFRGGILKWCADSGAGNILDRVSKYTDLGKRFAPTESLLQQAKQ